jgi:hypothetical protein
VVALNLKERHPSTQHLFGLFSFDHLPDGMQTISRTCSDLAYQMILQLPDGPELSVGLRKLLEAKDCFVRALL